MDTRTTVVYGERIAELLPALRAFRDGMTKVADGRYRVSVVLDRAEGDPLRRALMRAEAELLREEADAVGSDCEHDRTPPQRTADAFIRLAEAIAAQSRRATHA